MTGNKVRRGVAAIRFRAAGVETRAAPGPRSSLLPAPALQQQQQQRPQPPPPLQPTAALFPFSPRAGALAELRRAPGGAFVLRHLLLLLLLQRRLHLPLVAASVPAPSLAASPRLVPRSRRQLEHRTLRRPPPARERRQRRAPEWPERCARREELGGRGPNGPGTERLRLRRRRRLASAAASARPRQYGGSGKPKKKKEKPLGRWR